MTMTETKANPVEATTDREIVVMRTFDAPREIVFEASSRPYLVPRWWACGGMTMPVCEIDLRPGGAYRFVGRDVDGTEYPFRGTYLEVERPARIVHTEIFDVEPWSNSEAIVTVTLEDLDGKTRLTSKVVFPSVEAFEGACGAGMEAGMIEAIERLGELARTMAGSGVAAEREITVNETSDRPFVVARVFNAPRELVWKAFSEVERLTQWWGPKGFAMQDATLDFRPGGVFHYGLRSEGGNVMWGKFVYREIEAPERMVYVSSFSDEQGSTARAPFSDDWPLEVLNTLTFTEEDGRTTVTLSSRPIDASETERQMFEGMFDSMQKGFGGTFDQLDDYLAVQA